MRLPKHLRLPEDVPSRFALAGALILLVPVLVFGPWLPLLDLVSYVGMSSYPVKLSGGPLHFSVFQFTYIVHYALSRFLLDLGVQQSGQIVILYLLQGGAFFCVTQFVLRLFIADRWVCSMAIAAGVLAFWDSMFLWGGPLAFSLAAVSLAIATAITLREIDAPRELTRMWVALLAVLSMMCHPFAFPFAFLLVALRFVFVPRSRLHSVLLATALVVFAWVIRADSAESPDTSLSGWFAFSGQQLLRRFLGLIVADGQLVKFLYGQTPWSYWVYSIFVGLTHLTGFFAAPIVAWKARESPALRMLGVLLTVVGGLYFVAAENSLLTLWPQRILTFYSPFTYVAGIIFPSYLFRRSRPPAEAPRVVRQTLWLVPAVLLIFVGWVQIPILRFGAGIRDNLNSLRSGIVQIGLQNAFVMCCDIDRIQPFYLRAIPFLLFSDPELVRRNIIFYTEWHVQPRHPSRLVEQWFEIGRSRMQGWFSMQNGALALRFENLPPNTAPVRLGTNQFSNTEAQALAAHQGAFGDQLLGIGSNRDAIEHYQAALRLDPNRGDFLNNLGIALMRAGRGKEAIPYFKTALQLDPKSAEAHCNFGNLLVEMGEVGEGVQHLEAAVHLRPGIPEWHLELGSALVKAGRRSEAVIQFEEALALNPNLVAARVELERLKKL